MQTLAVDIETFSKVDLPKCGVYRYANDPSFTILLIAYAIDDEPVQLIDLTQPEVDNTIDTFYKALVSPSFRKVAYNAAFERACLASYIGTEMPPEQWQCSMAASALRGLPGSLAAVGQALCLAEDKQKMSEGKRLVREFCLPCKPTRSNGWRERTLPHHEPEKWELFKAYCIRDVETEREIRKLVERPEQYRERELWVLDQKINDHGIRVDLEMAEGAIICSNNHRASLEEEAIQLTGLDNPNSVSALKGWLEEAEGEEISSLSKKTVPALIKNASSDAVRRVLEIRQEMAKTSVSKYEAMTRAAGEDDRVRGTLQYYGANRTGRFAGRLVQMQNLPQNHLSDFDLDLGRDILKADPDMLHHFFKNVPDTLSQLIRTAFIPADGHEFLVADFSAIEARVIAWLADEDWRLQVFATHGKIYEASASAMFGVPIDEIKKGSPLRQKGKVAELALGYQGGPGALITMGALEQGLSEDELPKLVRLWRQASPNIVKLWRRLENAAAEAIVNGDETDIGHNTVVRFKDRCLEIKLPSGRSLVYQNASVRDGKLHYWGVKQGKGWMEQDTYGGKLVENVVQAIARDCLAEALLRLDEAGYPIAFHVHDEAVIEAPIGDKQLTLENACSIMGQAIDWAPGLLLRADGYRCAYYRKD